jgi:hypothetical protein
LEAANRRELKEATKKLKEASEEAIKHRNAEEIANDVAKTVQRIADEEAAAEVKRKQDEAAARSARKLKLNQGWMAGANTPTKLFESSPQKVFFCTSVSSVYMINNI